MKAAVKPLVELWISKKVSPNDDIVNLFDTRTRRKDSKKTDDEEFESYISLINYDYSATKIDSL